jgi:hypothetical protein
MTSRAALDILVEAAEEALDTNNLSVQVRNAFQHVFCLNDKHLNVFVCFSVGCAESTF